MNYSAAATPDTMQLLLSINLLGAFGIGKKHTSYAMCRGLLGYFISKPHALHLQALLMPKH
jgi:hypothetical protein